MADDAKLHVLMAAVASGQVYPDIIEDLQDTDGEARHDTLADRLADEHARGKLKQRWPPGSVKLSAPDPQAVEDELVAMTDDELLESLAESMDDEE